MSNDTRQNLATAEEPRSQTPLRRVYQAPVIEEVEIVAGEAMLGFCKTAGAVGAFAICGGGCGAPGS